MSLTEGVRREQQLALRRERSPVVLPLHLVHAHRPDTPRRRSRAPQPSRPEPMPARRREGRVPKPPLARHDTPEIDVFVPVRTSEDVGVAAEGLRPAEELPLRQADYG